MRSWRLLMVVAMACSSACWSDHAARTTMPAPAALGGPGAATAGPPPATSGIRFVGRRPENRCARVVAHLFEQSKSELTGMSDAFIEEMQQMTIASCEETAWSPESLDCYETTDSSAELTTCFSAMAPEQQDDFKKRMTELIQRQQSSSSPPPP